MQLMRYCEYCGAKRSETAKYCLTCCKPIAEPGQKVYRLFILSIKWGMEQGYWKGWRIKF